MGYVRSTAFGHTIGRTIAYGYVDLDKVAAPPAKITNKWLKAAESYAIGDRGARLPAELYLKAPFDPQNKRINGLYEEE